MSAPRSRLSEKVERRSRAEANAADLAKAVARKAIVGGWPAHGKLDELVLTVRSTPLDKASQ